MPLIQMTDLQHFSLGQAQTGGTEEQKDKVEEEDKYLIEML